MNHWDDNSWVARIQMPANDTDSPRIMLLLHGLNGDENVMWIFTRNLPDNYWFIAPRGLEKGSDGFSWLKTTARWHSLMDFIKPAHSIINELDHWLSKNGLASLSVDVMGFSQGAAMAFALAAFYPQKISQVIALAGYLPQDESMLGRYSSMANRNVYIAHGSNDNIIPFIMAEDAAETLKAAGANVTFCASEAGHKLSAGCLRGLTKFINQSNE